MEVGYDASIINVNGDRTTMAIIFDKESRPHWGTNYFSSDITSETITVAPTFFEIFYTATTMYDYRDSPFTFSQGCTKGVASSAIPTCTQSTDSPDIFPLVCRGAEYRNKFCTEGTTVPESFKRQTYVMDESFHVVDYQVVITAGEEKLRATNTAVQVTRPGNDGPTGGATAGSGTGVAMPMKTVGPAVAGLGAAMAVFVL
jgi:hypothetical protein